MIRSDGAVRRLLVLAMLTLGAAAPASVAGHGPDPVLSGPLFGQDQALEFRWRAGSEPPAILKTAVRDAASDSNASRGSRAATFAFDAGATSPVGYGWGTCGTNAIGCFTRSAPDGFTMWLREHGRVYDWGVLRWCQMQAPPTNGCYDAETIALDEFGHIEILNHHGNLADESDYTQAVVQTFSRTRPKAGYDMHRYGVCDVATLQVEYDIPGASSAYSTCLDVSTVLTIDASSTSIPYNGTVAVSALLKVATDADYGRLSANPVSGRTVKLQRRPPGASTWTTLATMTPTTPTGSYVTSVKLTSTTDFRAVFSTPTSEGLIGDTSPTIRVTVAACSSGPCPVSTEQ